VNVGERVTYVDVTESAAGRHSFAVDIHVTLTSAP